jgi:hypothetical protein
MVSWTSSQGTILSTSNTIWIPAVEHLPSPQLLWRHWPKWVSFLYKYISVVWAHPTHLGTFKSDDALVFHEFHEYYGGLDSNPSWVTTSPNVNWVPIHPSPRWKVHLCTDGLFGLDNPVNWPQPSIRGFEYLACICLSSANEATHFWKKGLGDDDAVG